MLQPLTPKLYWKSLSEIEALTGITFKTIKKRIGELKPSNIDGMSHLYDTRDVLPLLFLQNQDSISNAEDLTRERARLASSQADKTEIIVAQMRGELIDASSLAEALNRLFTNIRAKLLALPTKTAPSVTGLETFEIESVLKEQIYETLEEISRFDVTQVVSKPQNEDKEFIPC
jgi:hypothetical protein